MEGWLFRPGSELCRSLKQTLNHSKVKMKQIKVRAGGRFPCTGHVNANVNCSNVSRRICARAVGLNCIKWCAGSYGHVHGPGAPVHRAIGLPDIHDALWSASISNPITETTRAEQGNKESDSSCSSLLCQVDWKGRWGNRYVKQSWVTG